MIRCNSTATTAYGMRNANESIARLSSLGYRSKIEFIYNSECVSAYSSNKIPCTVASIYTKRDSERNGRRDIYVFDRCELKMCGCCGRYMRPSFVTDTSSSCRIRRLLINARIVGIFRLYPHDELCRKCMSRLIKELSIECDRDLTLNAIKQIRSKIWHKSKQQANCAPTSLA